MTGRLGMTTGQEGRKTRGGEIGKQMRRQERRGWRRTTTAMRPSSLAAAATAAKKTLTSTTMRVPLMLSGREIAPWRMQDGCDNDDESLFSGGGSSEAVRMEKAT
jgi:hypothetical protein